MGKCLTLLLHLDIRWICLIASPGRLVRHPWGWSLLVGYVPLNTSRVLLVNFDVTIDVYVIVLRSSFEINRIYLGVFGVLSTLNQWC